MATTLTSGIGTQLSGFGTQLSGFRDATGFGSATVSTPVELAKWRAKSHRRKVSPEVGKAIEKLAHAIEYLYDEFALDSISGHAKSEHGLSSRIAAIDLLKRLNRELYMNCPIIPTWGERLQSIFGK